MRKKLASIALAGVLILTLSGIGGCGGKELRTAREARQYVLDVIHGNAAKWDDLAADASVQARLAWEREARIQSFSRRLEATAEWACEAGDWAGEVDEAYSDFQELPLEQRESILRYFDSVATPEEIEAVIDEALALGVVEVALVTGEVCSF